MDQISDIIGINITGADGRRLSLPNFTNEVFLDDDPSEDWTKTTAEKDSWAYRERRRSSMRLNIDSYPSIYSSESSPSRSRSRRGSILSLFTHGKDKDGRDVLFSGDGDPEDWHVASKSERNAPKMADLRPQEPYLVSQEGILTPWIRGKDNQGRNVILWVQVEQESKSWGAK